MNNKTVLEKYIDKQHHKQLGHAHENGNIIGIEVDENNKIHYVVNRNGELTLEDYKTAQPRLFTTSTGQTIQVKSNSNIATPPEKK